MKSLVRGAAAVLFCSAATLALAQGPQERPERGGDRGERAGPQRGPGVGEMRQGPDRGAQVRERVERGTGGEEGRRGSAEQRIHRERARVDDAERRTRQQVERREERARQQVERREERVREREGAERRRGVRETERRQLERRDAERRQVERPDAERRQLERSERVQRSKEREDRADRARVREDGTLRRAERGDRVQRIQQARQERLRLSQEQRTRFHSAFNRRHVTNVNVSVRIGARLPRHVHLYPVPAVVVGLVPAYRYYRYVYIDDTICIVDPATYEIVDVIEYGSSGPAVLEARLSLTGWERSLILDSIAADFPDAEVDLRLALGAEVPRRVELHTFPPVVLDRIPKVRAFRFVVVDGDVIIVDPRDREIALVVRR